MMTHDRESLRDFYLETYRKSRQGELLTPLEAQVEKVLLLHPEYHALLQDKKILEKDFSVEMGDVNPFLHLGLHLGLREQLATNRPEGIMVIYQQLMSQKKDPHEVEHQMMDQLAEMIWLSQKYQQAPNEAEYLKKLESLLR